MDIVNSDGDGVTSIAPIVKSACLQAGPAVNGTARTPAAPVLTTSGKRQGLTPNTKRQPTVKRPCQQCGREMVVKRPSKRFCSAYCRRTAWLDRNPEKAMTLTVSDKARLRAHLESRGMVWIEQTA